jgi:hypothetical protein
MASSQWCARYQNGHFFLRQRDRKRLHKAVRWSGEMGANSDHLPVLLDFAILTCVDNHVRDGKEARSKVDRWKFHEEGSQKLSRLHSELQRSKKKGAASMPMREWQMR